MSLYPVWRAVVWLLNSPEAADLFAPVLLAVAVAGATTSVWWGLGVYAVAWWLRGLMLYAQNDPGEVRRP